MGWKKEPNIAELTPTAVIVALERDLLLSSLSRPVGSVRGIPSPAAVPAKAGPDARAAAEVIALIRRGAFVEALTCASAKSALIVPAAIEGQAAPSPDVDGVSALYASVEAAVESAGAAAAARGTLAKAGHELCILALGVAALNAFIQANVTGPDCRDAPHCPLTPSAPAADLAASADAWNKWALRSLARDGEDLVGRCFLPQYLYLAKVLLADRCAARAEEAFGADVDVAVATLAETRARAAKMAAKTGSLSKAGAGRVVLWPDEDIPPPSLTWWASRVAHRAPAAVVRQVPHAEASAVGVPLAHAFVVRAGQRGAWFPVSRVRGSSGHGARDGRVPHARRRQRRDRGARVLDVAAGDGADGARVRPRGQREGSASSGWRTHRGDARGGRRDGLPDDSPDGRQGADGAPRGVYRVVRV